MKYSTIKVCGNVIVKKGVMLNGNVRIANRVTGGGSYSPLTEKPQINYRTLESGNNTYEYLGLQEEIDDITEQDIDELIYGG